MLGNRQPFPPQMQNRMMPNQMPNQMMNPMMQRQMMQGQNPMMHNMQQMQNQFHPPYPYQQQQPQMRNRGGVLSKIFNRNQNQGQQPFVNNQSSFADNRGIGSGLSGIGGLGSAAGSGSGGLGGLLGGFRNLTSASSLSSMLGNVQGVMKTAESFLPMVQQYGLMVKNLPAMYKIYQALKTDDSDTSTSEEKKETKAAGKAEKVLPASKEETEYEEFLDDFAGKQNQGSSRPRLYTQTTRP